MAKIFITIILLFGSGVVGFFYLLPSWNEFQGIRKETDDLRNISAELDELTQKRKDLLDAINTVSRDDLKRIDSALPQGPKSAEFLVLLENLTNKHDLVLKRVDLASTAELKTAGSQPKPSGTPTVSASTVKEFPLSISVTGSYESFKGFLKDLEKNLRIVDILTLSFTSQGKNDQYDFSLKGKTYYQ